MKILHRDLILLVCNCAKKRIQEGLAPDVSEQTKTCSLRIDKDTQQDLHCDDSIDLTDIFSNFGRYSYKLSDSIDDSDTDNELMIMMTITLTI